MPRRVPAAPIRWATAIAVGSAAAVVGLLPAAATPEERSQASGAPTARAAPSAARAEHTSSEGEGSVVVSVLPGSLIVSSAQSTLTLTRIPGNGATTRYRGVMPSIRVVDTRGSLIGWSVAVRFFAPSELSVDGARLRVHPGRPVVVSGQRKGVHAAAPSWTTFGAPVSLFGAESGFGGGTYDDDAGIELVLPFAGDLASITLGYETSLS